MKWLLVLAVLFFVGCENIPYKDDLAYASSYVANSPELLSKVNGAYCVDIQGKPGNCTLSVPRGAILQIDIPPQPYAYYGSFDCSNTVQEETENVNVQKDEAHSFMLPAEEVFYPPHVKLFNCSVTIRPMDRPEPIALFMRVTVVVTEPGYVRLEDPVQSGPYFVLGQYAYFSWVYTDGKWKMLEKKTAIRDKNVKAAIVQSYQGRVSYYGNYKAF